MKFQELHHQTGYKKSGKKFIGTLTPTPHAHIGARIQPSS